MYDKEIKDNILEALKRNLLFGNDIIVDDFFRVKLVNDDKIQLVSFVYTQKDFETYIKNNNNQLCIPEWVDCIDKNCFKSLELFSSCLFLSNDKFRFGIKFPDNIKEVSSSIFFNWKNKFSWVIAKYISGEEDLLSKLYVHYLNYVYLPSFEVNSYNLTKYNGIHSFLYTSNKNLRVYFKNYQGTLGSLAILYSNKNNIFKRYCDIISFCVLNEFNEDGICIRGKSNLFKEIYGLSLVDDSNEFNLHGVDIELSYIPTWTYGFEDYDISDRGKLSLANGNFIMDKSISLLSVNCFKMSNKVQDKTGVLNIELSPVLKEIKKYSFKDLYCLEGVTIINRPILEDKCFCDCKNLKYLNFVNYSLNDFNINSIYNCNESVIINLSDWSGTIEEYKKLNGSMVGVGL